MGLEANFKLSGGFGHTSGLLGASGRFGTAPMPIGTVRITDGTGAGQANQVFLAALSIAAGATQLYDLKGGTGELDVLNAALAMTAVKTVAVEITTPAAATSLRFGPQNQANAAQLWFQAVTANFYDTILSKFFQEDVRAGWALDATHKVLAVTNPGAATVTGTLLVVGTK
jgi:hypothetical protein